MIPSTARGCPELVAARNAPLPGRDVEGLRLEAVPDYRVHPGGMHTHELAERAGVNPQTLRYYEQRGLLPQPPRSAAGYRAYPERAVATVRFVKRAQQLGFALGEIAELLELSAGGPAACDSARALAQSRMDSIAAKIADLHRMRESLQHLVDTCSRPHPQRECPLLDAVGHAACSSAEQETR